MSRRARGHDAWPVSRLASTRAAISGDPNNATARRLAARALLALGDPTAALAEIDQAIARAPLSILSHLRRAEVLLALGRPQDAAVALGAAASLGPMPPLFEPLDRRLRAAVTQALAAR